MTTNTSAKKKRRRIWKRRLRIAMITVCFSLILSSLGLMGFALYKIIRPAPKQDPTTADSPLHEGAIDQNTASFTFTGVGDNLLHDTIFVYYEQDHGNRDFSPIYEITKPYTSGSDLNYINFETVCAGDEYGLSGYPAFNGPLEMIDTIAAAGFNWISVASNHSLDAGSEGLITELNYLQDHHPQISATGAHTTPEHADNPQVKEINGIKVGLCTFTYGLNGLSEPFGSDWLVNDYRNKDNSVNYEMMKAKLDALKEVSDVQIVSMHWGEEYKTAIQPEQKAIAEFLHDQGVEVIIGTHPHVIQPVEFLVSEDQNTLVYYSLGNFVSAQNSDESMVGGMAQFQLDYDFETKKATFENVKFTPTVTYITPDLRTYRTTTIHEYNDEMIANHYMTYYGLDLSKEWIRQYVDSVVGKPSNIQIDYGV